MASTTTAADTAKSIPLPTFDGEAKNFQLWWTRFKAYAAVKRFSQAIQRVPDSNLPNTEGAAIDTTTAAGRAQAVALERNMLAIASLTMAFQTEGLINLMLKAESTDWPSGRAHLVVDALFMKYRPVDTISRVEMRTRLNNVCMKNNQDPKVLFDQLASIENAYNTASRQIDQDDLIAVVLEKAPKDYKSILTAEQRKQGANLTLFHLEGAMNDLYRTLHPNTTPSNDDNKEVALVAAFQGKCHYCKKPGHKANECRKKKAEQKNGKPCKHCNLKGHSENMCWELPQNASRRPSGWKSKKNGANNSQSNETAAANVDGPKVELLLNGIEEPIMSFPNNQGLLHDPSIWIADSAASMHMTPFEEGMINIKDNKGGGITVGSGEVIVAKKRGDIPCELCDKHGNVLMSTKITEVALIKNTPFNLFSLTKMMKQGWALSGDKLNGIALSKDGHVVKFDIPIDTPEGIVFAMCAKRTEVSAVAVNAPMNIDKAHRLLGHQSEEATRKTAKHLGWTISKGAMSPCLSCTIAKAKQKNTVKESKHEAAKACGERIFTDIASVKPKDGIMPSRPHWCIKVDERTQMKFSSFHKNKDDMVEPSCELFHKWNLAGKTVKFIRCDNAGENRTLENRANGVDWKLNIQFEYTPRDTPQHNHLAELAFASIANKGRALMSAANIPMSVRYKVWVKAFDHATALDGLIVVTIDGLTATRYEHWYGGLPKWVKHLKTWGESGTVKVKTKTTPKLADRGIQCMFVGHSKDHDGDCYEMWYPKTNSIYHSRDVVWLKRMYYNQVPEEGVEHETMELQSDDVLEPVEPNNDDAMSDEAASDDEEEKLADDNGNENMSFENAILRQAVAIPSATTRSGATFRDVAAANITKNLVGITKAEEKLFQALKTINELGCVGAGVGGGFEHTSELHVMKFDEAMASGNAAEWSKAVEEEHERMVENNVWTPVPKDDVPPGAKILTSTWAMKKKSNGKYRARLNGRGYEQVPGMHYDESSIASPVVSFITIRVALILMLMARWSGEILDVRGAFLKGTFGNGETLYMHVPQGMEHHYPSNMVLHLKKTIYGLKQAAYRFWIFLLSIVHELGCSRSKADPCLYYKWTENGSLLMWMSWVDDCFLIGPKDEVMKLKQQIMNAVDCDDGGELTEYVGCKLDWDKEKGILKFTQPVLLQSFKDEFDTDGSEMPVTPGVPMKTLQLGDKPPIDGPRRTYYRSGVGKLMHLRRWSRPDMANAVRDLSRYNTNGSEDHINAMHRAMRYAMSTPNRGLTLAPSAVWDGDPAYEFKIHGAADASYKPYEDAGPSVSGFAVFLEGAPISEKSNVQQCTTLSVTEAELVSGSQCAQDMLFAMRVLESVGLKVQKPMLLYIDNKGAVDYVNNWSTSGRMRHVGIRLSFMRELKEQNLIHVVWCKSEDMPADLFTKNLSGPLFSKHTKRFCGDDEYK